MTEVNVPLLRKAVEWVEAQAEVDISERQWMQGVWATPEEQRVEYLNHEPGCGTAYCVAGYIGQLLNEDYANHDWAIVDGESMHVSDFAEKQLGLTEFQGSCLFSATNSPERIRALAEEYAGGPL